MFFFILDDNRLPTDALLINLQLDEKVWIHIFPKAIYE